MFLFKLCTVLNYKSVAELKATMSHAELMQWMEYYSKEPFGYDRTEVQLAQISDILVKTVGEKDTLPVDFMISVSEEDKDRVRETEKQKKLVKQLEDF